MKIIIELDSNNKEDWKTLGEVLALYNNDCRTTVSARSEDIEVLELATKVRNALYRAKINTVDKLREEISNNDLRFLRSIGEVSRMHIVEHLKRYGEGKRGRELWDNLQAPLGGISKHHG